MKFEAIKLCEDMKHRHNQELLDLVQQHAEAESKRQEVLKKISNESEKKKKEKEFKKERDEDHKEVEKTSKAQEKELNAAAKKHGIDLVTDL